MNFYYIKKTITSKNNFVKIKNQNNLMNLKNKIILIEKADPGYDWIFFYRYIWIDNQIWGI